MVKLPGEPRSDTMTGWEPEPAPEVDDQPQLISGPSIAQRPPPAQSPKEDLYGELERLGGGTSAAPNLMSGPVSEQSSPLFEAYKPVLEDMASGEEIKKQAAQVEAKAASSAPPERGPSERDVFQRFRGGIEQKREEIERYGTKFNRNGSDTRVGAGPQSLRRFWSNPGSYLFMNEQDYRATAELELKNATRALDSLMQRKLWQQGEEPTRESKALDEEIQKAQERVQHAEDVVAGKKLGRSLQMPVEIYNRIGRGVVSDTYGNLLQGIGAGAGYLGKNVAGMDVSAHQNKLAEFGRWIEAKGHELYPTDPERAQDFSSKLAQGAGSFLGIYGVGGIAKVMGASDRTLGFVVALTGSQITGASTLKDAWESQRQGRDNTSDWQKFYSYLAGTVLGASEAMPVAKTLGSFGQNSILGRTLEGMYEEGLQEGGVTLGENLIANWLVGHDPERPSFQGVAESAAIGAILGGGMNATMGAIGRRTSQQAGQTTPARDEDDEAPAPAPEPAAPPAPAAPARSSAEIGTSGQSVPSKPVRAGLNTEPEVVTPDGSISMPVQTVLVELEDLVHATGDLRTDRAAQTSENIVQFQAANLDPLRLLPERVSDSGAPVITQDGTIVSGNARVQSIREVYSSQGFADRAQVYRSALGGEAAGMKHPVLVRKIQGNPSPEELVQFAQASNQPPGVESTEEIAAKIVDADPDATVQEDGGTPAEATETTAAQTEPSPFTPTDEQRAAFSEVLAGNAPRRQWQELVGATPEQIETLEREAVDDGRLRVRKNGKIGRTGKAKQARAAAASAPTVAIPADARLDNAIAAREAEGALITQPIAEYAWRVELVRGDVKKVQALIEEINNDKSFDKSDVLELAHLVGYAPKSRTTKAQALESIVARSKDLADTRDLGILPAIRAYHGSPHDFDKFRMSQIGTGEGAQAYGHGLYFAENPAVARDYQEAVSSRHMEDFATAQGRRLPDWVAQQVQSGGIEDAIKTFEGRIAHNKEQLSNDPAQPWVIEDQINNQTEILQALKAIKSGEDAVRGRGRLYEVNIKANKEDFLDWDKPLSEQGEAVRKMAASREHQSAIKALVEPEALEYDPNWMNLVYGGDIVRYLESKGPVRVFDEDAFGSTPAAHPVKASKSLAEAGIPGIRYLDQGSRGSGSGTYNYVVFDDSLIEITAKDGEPVSQEVKDQVTQQMSGEALFRLGGEAPVRPEFEAVSQQWMEDVAAYARQLVPSDVAVRIADGLGSGNLRFRGSFDPMARLLEISMEIGPQQAMEVARHEAVHVARVSGLWTKDEWKILTERAKKVGAEPTMIDRDGGVVSAMPRYEDFYTEQAAALFRGNKRRQQAWVREHLNQERVATLAESYASGKASYGTKINALLDRIGNLLQAMVNAARGLGFQTANDIFARLERGEIAARGETQVAEPVPESTRNDFMVGDVQGEITTREMSDGGRIRIYKTDDETYAGIRESQNGSWSVQMLNAPDPDTAEQLYQAVEDDIGQYLSPDGWLTPQAYEYWLATDPASVEGHQETGALFYGMYVPPGRVDVGVRALEQVATQSTGVQQRQARQKAQALRTIAAKTGASPVLPAMRGDIPQPVPLGQGTATEKPSKTLSDLVQLFNEQITDPQRTGRLDPGTKRRAANQGGRLVGQYNKNTGVTRLAIPLDFVTLTHEGGHALEHNRKTRDAVGELKLTHAEELITPPAPNVPAPQMPASGFAGIEIDADTQRRLVEFIEADASLKAMTQQVAQAKSQPRMFGRAGYNVRAYTQAQELAGKTRDKLVRRLGRSIADAVINDIQQQGIAADQVADYAARRFAQSGQPQPRQELQFTEDQLSEAWADWFQEYVTAPDSARRIAPDLYAEFEEALDGADPETLSVLEEIQDGYQELIQANPVAAVRSRIQSTIRPGLLQEFNERLRDRGVRRGLGEIITEWMYKTYTSYADNKHPMKVAVKVLLDLAEQNGRIKVGKNEKLLLKTVNDPYKRWRLAEHAKVHATQVLQSGVILSGQIDSAGPSFREALVEAFGGQTAGKWNEDVKEEFGAYLIARRVLAEFRRHDNGERDIQPDQLIDRQYWQQTKDELEQKYARFAKAADMMYEFNRNVLTWKFENGFLDEKLYQELMQREDYAPLNRVMDEKGGMASLTTARGRNKSGMIKRQLTSTRDFINPVEQIAQDVYASMARIELNGVIKGLDTVARAAGPGGGAIAERIPAFDMRGTKVDLREAIRAAAKDAGIDSQGYDNILEAVDDVFDQDAAATIFRAAETNERGENIVYLWEDGKRVPILMGDDKIAKDIFDQFVAFGADNTNFMLQVGVATTQALRFGVTKSPAYIMVNFFRDQLQTWILSPNYTPFVSGARGLGSTIGNLDDAKRYNAFAGMMGGVDSNLIQTSTAKRDIKSLRKQGFWSVPGGNVVGRTWNGFLRTMEVTEAATRVGHFKETFDRAKSDGMTDVEAAWEAAYAAHDVMDFSRRGAQMHTVARLVAFLNASLQGMDAMRRTVSGERNAHKQVRDLATPYLKAIDGQPLTVAEKQKLPTSARAVIKMLGIGMVGAALWMLYEDDEEAEEFNDYMRATHWFFKMGGTWWRYPKPFELAFFSNAMEAALDRFVKDDPRAGTKFLHSLYHTLVPPHELQVAKFYYEIVTGKDTFSNRDIVSMDLAKLPPEMQYNAYTSEFGKLVGSTLGLSPLQVDHFMQGAFATLGRDTLALSDLVLPQAQKMTGGALPGVTVAPKAEKSFEDMMVLSRFMRRASRGALSTQYFWENMSQSGGHFTAAAEGYKALQEAGRIDPARSRDAKAFLENLKDNEKAYAYLVAEFEEKHKDLHPLHRARQVMRAAGGIRKELLSGDIVKQASTKKGRDLDVIRMTPSDMRKVNEILQDVQMREARNALIVTGVDGWKQKSIMSVDGLLKELRSVSPAVADEYEYRRRKGRNKVYSFAAVKDLWPKAKKRLLEEGPDAFLSDLAAEARAY